MDYPADRQPTAEDWMRIVMLMLHAQGGEATINEVDRTGLDVRDWEVVTWKDPNSFAWKLRLWPREHGDAARAHSRGLPELDSTAQLEA